MLLSGEAPKNTVNLNNKTIHDNSKYTDEYKNTVINKYIPNIKYSDIQKHSAILNKFKLLYLKEIAK